MYFFLQDILFGTLLKCTVYFSYSPSSRRKSSGYMEHRCICTFSKINKSAMFFFVAGTCNLPLNHTVQLPSICTVSYSSGEQINTTAVNIGRCLNELCTADEGECQGGGVRCCCQTLVYRNMEYSCDLIGPTRTFNKIATHCGCRRCNISVSFVGVVINEMRNPLPLSTLTVGNGTQVLTDRYGMFGFTVPGVQSEVGVAALIASYAPYRSNVPVVPGGINFVLVQLLPTEIAFFDNEESLLVSALSLIRYHSVADFVSQSGNSVKGDSLVVFPSGYLGSTSSEEFQFRILPVLLDSNDTIFLMKERFIVASEPTALNSTRIGFAKREIPSEQIASFVAFGSVHIMNDLGRNVTVSPNMEMFITTYLDASLLNQSEVELFRLFVYDEESEFFYEQDVSTHVQTMNNRFVLSYNISNVTLPLTYIIGQRVDPICFTIVRVFNTEDIEQDRPVTVITRHRNRPEVTLFRGESSSCIPIPCAGELLIRVDNHFSTYQPSEIHYTIPTNDKDLMDEPYIYSTLGNCSSVGLSSSSDSTRFFTILESESLTDFPPTDTLDDLGELEVDRYCYIQVEIVYCDSKTVTIWLTNTFNADGRTIEHVRMINGAEVGENIEPVYGSGVECLRKSSKVCMEYVCGPPSQVNISVSHCFNKECGLEEHTPCYPAVDKQDSLFDHTSFGSSFVSFNSTVSKPGIYFSDDARDIAFYKCELDGTTALRFECPQRPKL